MLYAIIVCSFVNLKTSSTRSVQFQQMNLIYFIELFVFQIEGSNTVQSRYPGRIIL